MDFYVFDVLRNQNSVSSSISFSSISNFRLRFQTGHHIDLVTLIQITYVILQISSQGWRELRRKDEKTGHRGIRQSRYSIGELWNWRVEWLKYRMVFRLGDFSSTAIASFYTEPAQQLAVNVLPLSMVNCSIPFLSWHEPVQGFVPM